MMRYILLAAIIVSPGCKQKAPQYFQVDRATAGIVRGKVRFAGKAPAARQISMESEADCAALHQTLVFDEAVKAGRDGGLANVFIYLKTGLEGKIFEPPRTPVILDQHGCEFVPRVVALRAGQTLQVKNSDPVSHNIHPMPLNNRDWNQQLPPSSPDLKRRFAHPEVMIPVKCNIHGWMKTYIGVLNHPYFAVTDANGEFTLEPLPPGRYTIAAWHELFGETVQQIEVSQGKPAEVKFTLQ